MDEYKRIAEIVLGLMAHDPANPYRQGYSFANALNAVADHPDYRDSVEDPLGLAIVAEFALQGILLNREQYPEATMSVRRIDAT
jgi:hypothetical protein